MADEAPEEDNKQEVAEGEGGPNKKRLITMVAGLVVVLLIVGGGAFFFLSGGDEESSKDGSESAGSESADGESAGGESADGESAEGESADSDGSGTSGGGIVKIAVPDKENFGATYKLQPFHLNLGNPLENRQVMVEIALQYRGETEQEDDLKSRDAQLRDAVISIISRKTRDFLLGPDGKDQLRLEILTRLNQYLDQPIEQVYITDIMIE